MRGRGEIGKGERREGEERWDMDGEGKGRGDWLLKCAWALSI